MTDPAPDRQELDDLLDLGLATAFGMSGGAASEHSGVGVPALVDAAVPLETLADLPAEIGKYQVLELVAQGGMGVVARAQDRELHRDVAIKFLRRSLSANPALQRLFRDEARVMGGLQHPGIVAIHDLGTTPDGRLYYVMRLVAGQSLQALLRAARADRASELSRLLAIFARICETIAYAHDRGVVHGDLKPSNIMVGDFGEVQILDWGFARAARTELAPEVALADEAAMPRVMGTPAYMAPEQARGVAEAVDARTDVFALGGMLCEIVTGEPPYRGANRDEVYLRASRAWLDDAHARLAQSAVDPDVVRLANDCLSADPDARPTDAGVVAARVHGYLAAVEARARANALAAAEAQARADEERKARRTTALLSAVVVVALVAGILALLWYLRREDSLRREVEERVYAAMGRVDDLRARARAATAEEAAVWAEVVAQAHAVEQIASAPQVRPELRQRVATLKADVETEAQADLRDVRARALLSEVRPHRGEDRTLARIDADHRELLAVFGVDADADDLQSAASAIHASSLAPEIAQALHHWGHLRRQRKEGEESYWRRLFQLADVVDHDPWRTELRRMCCQRDLPALRTLATSPQAADIDGRGLAMLAECLESGGDRELAVSTYRVAHLHQPEDYAVAHDLAVLLGLLPSPPHEEITRLFTAAAAVRPHSPHALADLAMAYFEQGDRDAASTVIERARRLDPNYRRTWVCLMVLRGKRDPAGALAAAREVVRLSPQRAQSHLLLAHALVATDAREEALAACQRAVQLAPQSVEARTALAVSQLELGYLDVAVTAMRATVALDPRDAKACYHLGLALAAAGIDGEAESAYRQAIELDAGYAESWCNLGEVLSRRAAFAEAIEAVRRGAALGRKRADWAHPTDDWIAGIDRMAARVPDLERLQAELAGNPRAAEGRSDLIALGKLALARGDASFALSLFETACADGKTTMPLDAVFAAGRIVGALGAESGAAADERRDHASGLALHILRTLTQQIEGGAERGQPANASVRTILCRWLLCSDLEPLRQPERLAALPERQRVEWTELWQRVAALRDKLQ